MPIEAIEPVQPAELPPIPAKRYFSIGEVSELCGVKTHVLRYWEQEFSQLKPLKRSGNRRYYQHHEVLLVRKIRHLLYDEGFTISGARHRLDATAIQDRENAIAVEEARALLTELRGEVETALDILREAKTCS
ncbi:MAG: MerR family transcriptional regulator [Azoarcus sp.]|jgi:DNA-binding transcriptional MerR regulator|nr:MerR family transcriptional regulator [Azoarcus sp.]